MRTMTEFRPKWPVLIGGGGGGGGMWELEGLVQEHLQYLPGLC